MNRISKCIMWLTSNVLIGSIQWAVAQQPTPYQDWLDEDQQAYEGKYMQVQFSDNTYEKITYLIFSHLSQKPRVIYETVLLTAGKEERTFAYYLLLEENHFKVKFKNTPYTLIGRFVYKYLADKGPIQKGVLIEEQFFALVEE
ncbi:MAG: hypothetical protein ACFB0B_19205 [Thermonemataceae bacterium]